MRYITIILLLVISFSAQAQSDATESFHKRCHNARVFFFYNNTLRMINQGEDKNFDDLIKDIERMKLLIINKTEEKFNDGEYKKLIADYKKESFEEIMATRHEGKSFNIYLKEKDGKTKGMIVTVNDTDMMYVLDIVGSVALTNIQKFFKEIEGNTDIARRIENLTGKGKDKEKDEEKDEEKSKH